MGASTFKVGTWAAEREKVRVLAEALAFIADDVGHPRLTAESMQITARTALRAAGRLSGER